MVWVSEAQEQAKGLMAWMERNAKASEGPTARMSEAQIAEDEDRNPCPPFQLGSI
jgi:hypothetical protein